MKKNYTTFAACFFLFLNTVCATATAASLGDYVWEDTNGNGLQDAGEPGIANVPVTLLSDLDSDGAIDDTLAQRTTDASGLYLFDNLTAGTYVLRFGQPTGYFFSAHDLGGNDATDSDADATTGLTGNIVLAEGESNPTYDAGYYRPCAFGDYVWEDMDGDGMQDPGEPGIPNVTVTLTGTTGTGSPFSATTTTNAVGKYLFANLLPGVYKLTVNPPTGSNILFTVPDAGDAECNSDIVIANMSRNYQLTSGETNAAIDAGMFRPCSIGDLVWEDMNGEGVQDVGEWPLSGVMVVLTGTAGDGIPVSNTTLTNTNGNYQFNNLKPGTYKVAFTAPPGYTFTAADRGTNDANDSDANGITGMTLNEVLVSGENNANYDAGFYKPASIGDWVWDDINANGIQDAAEPGIPEVTMVLSGTTGAGSPVNASTTTNASGHYLFDKLAPGTYKLTFTAPAGHTVTAADRGGDDTKDSDANEFTGTTQNEVLISGENNLTYDAGYYKLAAIGGKAWEDTNANGVQDAGEPGLPGVQIALTGTDGLGSPVALTTTTDLSGQYLFGNLMPGTYKLTFTTPSGFRATAADKGSDDAKDSDANPNTGMTPNEVLVLGEPNPTYDAGYYRPASIGNFTWDDSNGNGVQDAGEPGLSGVQIALTGTDGLGIPVALTTTTDLSGQYLFGNLVPGIYKLTFSTPFGGKLTAADRGTNDAKDSDANPATGQTIAEVLVSDEHNENYDAGYIELQYFIEGKVVYDKNFDCQADTAELGLGGVIVKATFGNEQYHARSQADGRYKLYAPNNRTYQLSAEPPKPVGGATCSLPPVFLALVASRDIPLQNVVPCAALSVDIGTAFLRRCAQGTYQVKYCNEGIVAAENAYIDIHLDSFLNLQSAGRTYVTLGDNWYRFPIGKINPFDCGHFSLKVEVSCAATLGQTHCTEAHIYPDGVCYFDNAQWSGAKLEAHARCTGDSLHFILKNTGTGPMTVPLEFVIIEDGVMSAPVKTDPLDPKDSLKITLPGNGSTWRIQARQEPTYRGWSQPVMSVEGCTQNSAFSLGFVNQFAQNESAPALDLDCTANVGSYDPNDKGGIPLGLGSNRYIEPLTELEYMIRFQNTGTDTAFQVVLRDTLSAWFDLASFRPGASSHPYTVELRGNGVLVFDFPDIVLPHKAINELGSQGFVRYSITPKATTPLQTRLFNRAGIYFDQNAPVITNRTLHRLGVNFVPVSVWQPQPVLYDMRLAPNPMGDWVNVSIEGDVPVGEYRLKVFSAAGQLLQEQQASTPHFQVFAENFPEGPLFFHVLGAQGEILGIGMGIK